mgnify:CR=1 FL=1
MCIVHAHARAHARARVRTSSSCHPRAHSSCAQLSGVKRFALFEPTPHALRALQRLDMLPYPVDHAFAYDPFAQDQVSNSARKNEAAPVAGGLVTTLEPGELLYVPGEFIHAVTNVGSDPTLGLCTRLLQVKVHE